MIIKCNYCGVAKDVELFHSFKKDKKCRVCYSKEYKRKNIEKVKEQKKAWDLNNKEKIREYERKRYERNREKLLENAKIDRKANPEKYRKSAKRYRDDNREKIRGHNMARYSKNRNEILEKAKERRKKKEDELNNYINGNGNRPKSFLDFEKYIIKEHLIFMKLWRLTSNV